MAVESHLPFGGESESSQDEAGFEPAKSRRKSRRERRAERIRNHALEPHTIWMRSDPDHLQPPKPENPAPEKSAESRPEAKPAASRQQESPKNRQASERRREAAPDSADPVTAAAKHEASSEVAMPAPQKRGTSARKSPQPESLAELLKLQELPSLDIHPRHFYSEPEVRQKGATQAEHDILPSMRPDGEAEKPAERPKDPPKKTEQHRRAEAPVAETHKSAATAEANAPAQKENPREKAEREAPQPATAEREEQLRAGEQLQQIAEQTAQRAAELADRHRSEAVAEAFREGSEANVRMDKVELLSLAESIRVEGISVSEMFRAGRLDEDGLRRVVVEFLRGHDIRKLVAEEVLRVQMKFERDPQLRNTSVANQPGAAKRAATGAKLQAKKVLNPKTVRHNADRLADHLANGLDRLFEAAEDHPREVKMAATALAVVIYFVVLIAIIKS
jgi:hypothetical protein